MSEPELAQLIRELKEEHRVALVRMAMRMKQIQDKKLHAEIVLKFQDGLLCRGGGMNTKDGPCPFAGGFMVKD